MARGKGTRGGYRKPANPAPVSPPGSGARTDGGPGDRQPIRAASGQPYGERQATINAQRAMPLPEGNGSPMAASPVAGQSNQPAPLPPIGPMGAFGPSPNGESRAVAGLDGTPAQEEILDPEIVIRILHGKYPSPWLLRLLDDGR